jgi:hypothetical protein
MDFLNQIFDYLIEIYPNILNKNPISFHRYILNNYIHGDINLCKEKFAECFSDVTDDELKQVYLQLLAYMYSRKSYDLGLIKYFHSFVNIGRLMENDFIFQYKIFTLSFDNIKLFKFVLYTTDKWYEPFSLHQLRILNQDKSSAEQTQQVATPLYFGEQNTTTGGQFQNAVFTYTDINNHEYEITVEMLSNGVNDVSTNAGNEGAAVFENVSNLAQSAPEGQSNQVNVVNPIDRAVQDNSYLAPESPLIQNDNLISTENRDLNTDYNNNYNNNYENYINSYQNQTNTGQTNNFFCSDRQGVYENLSIISDACQNCLDTEDGKVVAPSNDKDSRSESVSESDSVSIVKKTDESETEKKPTLFNESNYLIIALILGGKWHLIWFLDWMEHNSKLDRMKELYKDYVVWFAIHNSKFECATILKKYNFQDNFMYAYKYKFLDEYEYFKTIRVKKGTLFFKSNIFHHMSIESFKSKFIKIHCSLYKKFLLGSEEESVTTLCDEQMILDWNMDILYYLDFPKKVILMAIQDLCIESNHLFCSSIEHIEKTCHLIMKKELVAFMRQIYNFRVRDGKQSKVERMIVEKLEALSLYKKSDTKECMICFDSFQADCLFKKSKGMLSCQHFFHKDCLTFWRREKNQCPYCRKEIYKVVTF